MRFHADGPSIPDQLLNQCDEGGVVFLCGAGVSIGSNMPSFIELTQNVINSLGPPDGSEVVTKFKPWIDQPSAANVPLDQIFNLLMQLYGKEEVGSLVSDSLSIKSGSESIGKEHGFIKRISSSPRGKPQIVTTNFDRLFELGGDSELKIYQPPAFSNLSLGSGIEGITYLHGRLADESDPDHNYVLSSADFGRAYLAEGWATQFIRHLLERYTVVLVGYQAEDPPIKYLLQGLNYDGQYDRSKLYAFDCGRPEDIEAKWRNLGITAIAYTDHPKLWSTMEAWANRADDPRKWRASVIEKCSHDPKTLAAHERGQFAHVIRTVHGAKLLGDMGASAHPEWICVMDSNLRLAQESYSWGDTGSKPFDPYEAYALDDDSKVTSNDGRKQGIAGENLLISHSKDKDQPDAYRLSDLNSMGREFIPARLDYLIRWIGRSCESPVIAWWAAKKRGLHPNLLHEINWQIKYSKTLCEQARHTLRFIHEYQRDSRIRDSHNALTWHDLEDRVNDEGWTTGALRELRQVSRPELITELYVLNGTKPPSLDWSEANPKDIGQWGISYQESHFVKIPVPDDALTQVFKILEDQFTLSVELIKDIEIFYYKDQSNLTGSISRTSYRRNSERLLGWFIEIFDRLAIQLPEAAKAFASLWSIHDPYYFRELKLRAFSKPSLFKTTIIATELLALESHSLWDLETRAELLDVLVKRWGEFSAENQTAIISRIFTGPTHVEYGMSDDSNYQDYMVASYVRYLQLKGCKLSADQSNQISNLIDSIEGCNDDWARSLTNQPESHSGWVATNEDPDVLLNLPAEKISGKAKEETGRGENFLIENRPFLGLVKSDPKKALDALVSDAKSDQYERIFWTDLLDAFPKGTDTAIIKELLHQLSVLPYETISDLGHSIGRWIKDNLTQCIELEEELAWKAFDHTVDGLFSIGAEATRSGIVTHSDDKAHSRVSQQTYSHAINGPIGHFALALIELIANENTQAPSVIPEHIKSRFERLITAPGEGAGHAAATWNARIRWLFSTDPEWTLSYLKKVLDPDHPASSCALDGFLLAKNFPSALIEPVKPYLLGLVTHANSPQLDKTTLNKLMSLFCDLRIYHSDKPFGLTQTEVRDVLRAVDEEARNCFIFALSRIVDNKEGQEEAVVSFINNDWPKENTFKTTSSTTAWVNLLNDSGNNFEPLYHALKKFLVPINANEYFLVGLMNTYKDDKSLVEIFPETVLDFIHTITPKDSGEAHYYLPRVLEKIADVSPELASDTRYLQLMDLMDSR